MTKIQNAYYIVVVSWVQGNDQNIGVTNVEAFTSVAICVLKSITLYQFKVSVHKFTMVFYSLHRVNWNNYYIITSAIIHNFI